jgi:non-ribosomal peptide synthetase component E (peptide arylation enzyme)
MPRVALYRGTVLSTRSACIRRGVGCSVRDDDSSALAALGRPEICGCNRRSAEEQLQTHPAIQIAQLVGVWREQKGDLTVAFVGLVPAPEPTKQNSSPLPAQALYKVPRRALLVDDFPTTDGVNGRKIQENRLREIAQEDLGE